MDYCRVMRTTYTEADGQFDHAYCGIIDDRRVPATPTLPSQLLNEKNFGEVAMGSMIVN